MRRAERVFIRSTAFTGVFMKIFIVFGSSGEYSDHQEWTVKAFYDEDRAKELVERATIRGKEIEKKFSDERKYFNRYEDKGLNEFDPDFIYDYSGFNYYIEETELI
jgi:hypothetical protein